MPSERITDARTLRGGDVVTVAVQLRDRKTGNQFWWKRFACVTDTKRTRRQHAMLLTLKPNVDLDKDLRVVDFDRDIVKKLEEHEVPQGAVAMRMKYITLGAITVDTSDLT